MAGSICTAEFSLINRIIICIYDELVDIRTNIECEQLCCLSGLILSDNFGNSPTYIASYRRKLATLLHTTELGMER